MSCNADEQIGFPILVCHLGLYVVACLVHNHGLVQRRICVVWKPRRFMPHTWLLVFLSPVRYYTSIRRRKPRFPSNKVVVESGRFVGCSPDSVRAPCPTDGSLLRRRICQFIHHEPFKEPIQLHARMLNGGSCEPGTKCSATAPGRGRSSH